MNIPKYLELYRKELALKGYADNTIKNYSAQVDFFLRNHEKEFTEPSKINEDSIKTWLLQFKKRNSMAHSISALKLFYKSVVKQPMKFKYIDFYWLIICTFGKKHEKMSCLCLRIRK